MGVATRGEANTPSGSRYYSAGDGNTTQQLAVPSGAHFTRGSPPKRSFFGAFLPILKFSLQHSVENRFILFAGVDLRVVAGFGSLV